MKFNLLLSFPDLLQIQISVIFMITEES